VALVTLGCARNEVDSEELAARLNDAGWVLRETDDADVIMVNTCGFVDAAKKDSIDALMAAADTGKRVVAVGCLAERYGEQLAASLPEADAVVGFDSYVDIGQKLDDVMAGRPVLAHQPQDRRALLPITPISRPAAATELGLPGHAWLPTGASRKRLSTGPLAYLKLASGCDRRCSFCAIPSFRGSFVSRPPAEVVAEARWLASTGVREVVLVSENSTSYGKDLGDLRALESLLPRLAEVDGLERVRVAYLQPAELRPDLLRVIAATEGVVPYFDLSFQHASSSVLRRMRRFGSTEAFLELLQRARDLAPDAGARSNVIVGFPGETPADVDELIRFLELARLDAIGVFGYSDEEGTEAEQFEGKLTADEIDRRVRQVSAVADELLAQRAEERIGAQVEVLVEHHEADDVVGRAAHQGPDVDGTCRLVGDLDRVVVGSLVSATVLDSEGVDLVVESSGALR